MRARCAPEATSWQTHPDGYCDGFKSRLSPFGDQLSYLHQWRLPALLRRFGAIQCHTARVITIGGYLCGRRIEVGEFYCSHSCRHLLLSSVRTGDKPGRKALRALKMKPTCAPVPRFVLKKALARQGTLL